MRNYILKKNILEILLLNQQFYVRKIISLVVPSHLIKRRSHSLKVLMKVNNFNSLYYSCLFSGSDSDEFYSSISGSDESGSEESSEL